MVQASDGLETRVKEVAARSANFGFLLPHDPLLVLYGAQAEANVFVAPSLSLVKGHQFGETLATDLVHLAGIRVISDTQTSRLQALTRAGFLTRGIRRAFDDLSRLNSETELAQFAGELGAIRAVRQCFQLGVWFHRLRTNDRELPNLGVEILTGGCRVFARADPADTPARVLEVIRPGRARVSFRADHPVRHHHPLPFTVVGCTAASPHRATIAGQWHSLRS